MDYFVALDAGHGILTSGKKTHTFTDGTFMREWEFNNVVMQKVYNKLTPYKQIDVFLSNTEKYDVDLDVRVKRINEAWQAYQNKLGKNNVKGVLISIHANADGSTTWSSANGTATFYYQTNMTDKAFAEVIQKNLIKQTGLNPHRGGVVGDNFQIIRESMITACLCECAFMTNKKEAELLRTDEFREKCAEGIFNGILEYFGIAKISEKVEVPKVEIIEKPKPIEVIKPKIEYAKTANNTFMLSSNVENLKVKEVNKSNGILLEENYVNSTFFWHLADGKKYSTSILYSDGTTYQYYANHLPQPQSCFIIYKDNTVDMKRLYNLGELNLNNVKTVIGGVGILNKLDKSFKYDLYGEGFRGVQADVARKTNKTMIVYNKKEDKIYLVCRPNIYHQSSLYYDLIDLAGDIGDIAVATDGGGSTTMGANGKIVFNGDSRVIHSILYF